MEEMDTQFLPFLIFMSYLRHRKSIISIKMGKNQCRNG